MAQKTLKQRRQFTLAYTLRQAVCVTGILRGLRGQLNDLIEEDRKEDKNGLSVALIKDLEAIILHTNNASTHVNLAIMRALTVNHNLAKVNKDERLQEKKQKQLTKERDKLKVIKIKSSQGVDTA